MPQAVGITYSVPSGQTIYAGRSGLPQFDSAPVAVLEGSGATSGSLSKVMVLELHGSSGQNFSTGRQYEAPVSGLMAYVLNTVVKFSVANDTNPAFFKLRPIDQYNNGTVTTRETAWLGAVGMGTAEYNLITQTRLIATFEWGKANLQYIANKTCLKGRSMGAWGSMTFGLRRPDEFAAIYADMPRWRYSNIVGRIGVANWASGFSDVLVASAPNIRAENGGGNINTLFDCIAFVSNASNQIPWLGWVVGKADGFTQFSDHVDAVAAMRATKRGFSFHWNNLGHSDSGPLMTALLASYPIGTFEIGVGYPIFTNHSGDSDTSADTGSINGGLSFRSVVESAGAWSCEVTSILGARTVDVEPYSSVFTATVSPQSVVIPAANTWVSVSFSA